MAPMLGAQGANVDLVFCRLCDQDPIVESCDVNLAGSKLHVLKTTRTAKRQLEPEYLA